MTTYTVAAPITGVLCIDVQAESEEEAMEKVWMSDDITIDNIEEWEMHTQICQGNVFHGIMNEMEIVDSYEEEDY